MNDPDQRVARADTYLRICTLSDDSSTRAAQLKRFARKLLSLGLTKDETFAAINRRYPRALSVSDLQDAITAIELERRHRSQSAREYQDSGQSTATSPTPPSAQEERDLFGSLIEPIAPAPAPAPAYARAREYDDALDDNPFAMRPVRPPFFVGSEAFDIEAQRVASELVKLRNRGVISEHDKDLATIAAAIHMFEANASLPEC